MYSAKELHVAQHSTNQQCSSALHPQATQEPALPSLPFGDLHRSCLTPNDETPATRPVAAKFKPLLCSSNQGRHNSIADCWSDSCGRSRKLTGELETSNTSNTFYNHEPQIQTHPEVPKIPNIQSFDGNSVSMEPNFAAGVPGDITYSNSAQSANRHLGYGFTLTIGSTQSAPQAQLSTTIDDQNRHKEFVAKHMSNIVPYKHFPQRFGFYNDPYSVSILSCRDIAIARNKTAAASSSTRDCKITLRPKFWARPTPWLTLHGGSSSRDPALAVIVERAYIDTLVQVTVDIHPIILNGKRKRMVHTLESQETNKWMAGRTETLHLTNDPCYEFTCLIPSTGEREKFQWESCWHHIDDLEPGPKFRLIRTKTTEMVAGWSRPRKNSLKKPKRGKMGFYGSWNSLGQDFEILAVMSAVVSIEIESNYGYDRGCGGVLGKAHLPLKSIWIPEYGYRYFRICC